MTEQQAQHLWIPDDTFGDRLRRIRRHVGLSQGEFAARIDEGDRQLDDAGLWAAARAGSRAA